MQVRYSREFADALNSLRYCDVSLRDIELISVLSFLGAFIVTNNISDFQRRVIETLAHNAFHQVTLRAA